MDNLSEGTFSNPQDAGFQTILLNGSVNDKRALSTGLPEETIRPWIYNGAVFVGEEAVEVGVVMRAVGPFHPRPLEHKILDATE